MIYGLAKKLGQSEEYIKENYTWEEIIERSMFDNYDSYIQREVNK